LLLRWSRPIAVACVSGALRQVTILTAFAAKEDEGVFRPLDWNAYDDESLGEW